MYIVYIIYYNYITLYSHFLFFRYELYSSNQHRFQEEATRQLVGSVVLTRYNNRTYRIDDIAWDKNPQSTFIDHTGKALTFIEYYRYGNHYFRSALHSIIILNLMKEHVGISNLKQCGNKATMVHYQS